MTSSRRDWDYSKTFTLWPGHPRPEVFPYVLTIPQIGHDGQPFLTFEQTEWCKHNCQYAWAWWFDASAAYIGFVDQQECMLFAMTNL